jgi:DNA-directed RNA polymerase subunit RPC12/RpoP
MMKYICAYCGAEIKVNKDVSPGESLISHGLCCACSKLSDEDLNKLAQIRNKEREDKSNGKK